MNETNEPGMPVKPSDVDTIGGGASEGDCLTPDTPDQQAGNGTPWWRSLQDALGNLLP